MLWYPILNWCEFLTMSSRSLEVGPRSVVVRTRPHPSGPIGPANGPPPFKKCKCACFTLNNYTDVEVAYLQDPEPMVHYICFQKEVGKGGTPHLQGYVEFQSPVSYVRMQQILRSGRIHFEKRRGTADQARDYCRKDGGLAFWENRPWTPKNEKKQASRKRKTTEGGDLENIYDLVKDGTSLIDIVNKFPATYIKHHSGVDKVFMMTRRLELPFYEPRVVIVYFGPSGIGKTRRAWRTAIDKYEVNVFQPHVLKDKVWFDGYCGEGALLFDDFRGEGFGWSEFLRLCDGYPLVAPVKGAHAAIEARYIFFTSDVHPFFWYRQPSSKLTQLRRRIAVLEYMNVPYLEQPDYRALVEGSEEDIKNIELWPEGVEDPPKQPPPAKPLRRPKQVSLLHYLRQKV